MHRRIHPDSPLALRRDACVALNYPFASCGRFCEKVCPVGALQLGIDVAALAGACIDCGRCAAACPTGALRLEGCDVPDVLPAGVQPVRVECRKVPITESSQDAVRVPCLAGLAVSQWLGLVLAAEGRRVEVMDRGWCCQCSSGGETTAYCSLDETRALLAQMGLPGDCIPERHSRPLPLARMQRSIPAADRPVEMNRRGFFGRAARGATAAETAATPAIDDSAAQQRVRPGALATPERQRRLQLLERLANRTGARMPSGIFPTLVANAECRDYQICAAVCPTRALHAYVDDGHRGIAFNTAACIECGVCITACVLNALSFEGHAAEAVAGVVRLTRRAMHERRD